MIVNAHLIEAYKYYRMTSNVNPSKLFKYFFETGFLYFCLTIIFQTEHLSMAGYSHSTIFVLGIISNALPGRMCTSFSENLQTFHRSVRALLVEIYRPKCWIAINDVWGRWIVSVTCVKGVRVCTVLLWRLISAVLGIFYVVPLSLHAFRTRRTRCSEIFTGWWSSVFYLCLLGLVVNASLFCRFYTFLYIPSILILSRKAIAECRIKVFTRPAEWGEF